MKNDIMFNQILIGSAGSGMDYNSKNTLVKKMCGNLNAEAIIVDAENDKNFEDYYTQKEDRY